MHFCYVWDYQKSDMKKKNKQKQKNKSEMGNKMVFFCTLTLFSWIFLKKKKLRPNVQPYSWGS